MKEKLKKIKDFILNPRLLLCLLIGWMITNGWSYILLALGTIFEIEWMLAVSGGYIAFLWLPLSPEKVITVGIAIFLMQKFFPDDEKTLAVLKDLYKNVKESSQNRKQKKKNKKKASD
ncbi:MAG: hypothetical protein IKL70_04710 [Oscillospiraceae bacterium]|nr:hypothetical protein [Oscillospiraceae bacterium]